MLSGKSGCIATIFLFTLLLSSSVIPCYAQSGNITTIENLDCILVNTSGNVTIFEVDNFDTYITREKPKVIMGSDYERLGIPVPSFKPKEFSELPRFQQMILIESYAEYYVFGIILFIFSLLGFTVFAKLIRSRKQLLDSPERARIFQEIKEDPGATKADLASRLNMNTGTLRYHLDMLEKAKLIIIVPAGKFMRVFQNQGVYDDTHKKVISVLKSDNNRKIIETIVRNPGIGTIEVSDRTGLPKSAASKYLNQLVKDGILINKRNANNNSYFIKNEIEQVINELL